MSKIIYYQLQLVGLRETVPSTDIMQTIVFNGYDTGVNRYYFVLGNTLPQPQGYDPDYLEYKITQATFTPQDTNQTVPVQTEIETLHFPVWVSKVVPDNFSIPTPTDLVIKLNSVSPTTLNGGYLTVDYTLTNVGDVTAGSSKVGIYLSDDAIIDRNDTLISSIDTAALNGHMYYRVTAPISASSIAGGQHYVGAIADMTNSVSEGNGEGNNTSNAIKINVITPSPDLRVGLKLTSSSTVAVDGELTFDMSLYNCLLADLSGLSGRAAA